VEEGGVVILDFGLRITPTHMRRGFDFVGLVDKAEFDKLCWEPDMDEKKRFGLVGMGFGLAAVL
jgi:hypothetical protein